MNHVWLLGAGFSKSLDGPLLNDFFTPGFVRRLNARFNEFDGALERAHFHALPAIFGKQDENTGRPIGQSWTDVEAFLAAIDTAAGAPGSTWSKVFAAMTGPNFSILQLSRIAKQYVGLGTDLFIPDDVAGVAHLERWAPYRQWAMSVKNEWNSIISFNYDRVVEVASGGSILPALPIEIDEHDPRGHSWFYKLHGSVTWADSGAADSVPTYRAGETGLSLLRDRRMPYLGLPGPSKFSATKGALKPLWSRAMMHLHTAERIHIVGFRLPPGDSDVRTQILGALRENGMPHIVVNIVLGANTAHEDVRRVEGLIRWSLRHREESDVPLNNTRNTFRLNVVPLFAEDYIVLYDPN